MARANQVRSGRRVELIATEFVRRGVKREVHGHVFAEGERQGSRQAFVFRQSGIVAPITLRST